MRTRCKNDRCRLSTDKTIFPVKLRWAKRPDIEVYYTVFNLTRNQIQKLTNSHTTELQNKNLTRKGGRWQLLIPRTHNTFGDRSFFVAGNRL